ncbi:YceI family protein [Dactylosporangium sp. NPDC049525]|uniref:YceI family protein n=1 Tax=Dactylosporangium sp. NPDC049525 TaxID=3154730 RepID=UPI0034336E13
MRIDPARSTVRFCATHALGLGPVEGTLAVVEGEVDVERQTAWAVLDATSFSTGNPRRDKDIKDKRFLDVARFPTIRFDGTAPAGGDGQRRVTGTLTVRDVTRPVTLEVVAARPIDGGQIVRATGTIDRRVFGVVAGRGLIRPRLTVTIDVYAVS